MNVKSTLRQGRRLGYLLIVAFFVSAGAFYVILLYSLNTHFAMSEFSEFTYDSYAKIAAAFIDGLPTCHVHYGYDHNEHRYLLIVEHTGLYLRDVRCWLPEHITVKYGNTQDTIIFDDAHQDMKLDFGGISAMSSRV